MINDTITRFLLGEKQHLALFMIFFRKVYTDLFLGLFKGSDFQLQIVLCVFWGQQMQLAGCWLEEYTMSWKGSRVILRQKKRTEWCNEIETKLCHFMIWDAHLRCLTVRFDSIYMSRQCARDRLKVESQIGEPVSQCRCRRQSVMSSYTHHKSRDHKKVAPGLDLVTSASMMFRVCTN